MICPNCGNYRMFYEFREYRARPSGNLLRRKECRYCERERGRRYDAANPVAKKKRAGRANAKRKAGQVG